MCNGSIVICRLDLRHEVKCLVEVLLSQRLKPNEIVVVFLCYEALGKVPQSVDAGFASKLNRPALGLQIKVPADGKIQRFIIP
jgi:hypothetical protein